MDGIVALSVGLFVSQSVTLVPTAKIHWMDFLEAHTNIQVAWTMAFNDVDDQVTFAVLLRHQVRFLSNTLVENQIPGFSFPL